MEKRSFLKLGLSKKEFKTHWCGQRNRWRDSRWWLCKSLAQSRNSLFWHSHICLSLSLSVLSFMHTVGVAVFDCFSMFSLTQNLHFRDWTTNLSLPDGWKKICDWYRVSDRVWCRKKWYCLRQMVTGVPVCESVWVCVCLCNRERTSGSHWYINSISNKL